MRWLAPLLMVSAALVLAGCGDATDPATAPDPAAAVEPRSPAVMPEDAPPQEEAVAPEGALPGAADRTCTESIGAQAAVRLAERCTMVSPASHPPCNPDNACALIRDEIDRACGQYGPGETKPAECAA